MTGDSPTIVEPVAQPGLGGWNPVIGSETLEILVDGSSEGQSRKYTRRCRLNYCEMRSAYCRSWPGDWPCRRLRPERQDNVFRDGGYSGT